MFGLQPREKERNLWMMDKKFKATIYLDPHLARRFTVERQATGQTWETWLIALHARERMYREANQLLMRELRHLRRRDAM